MDWLHFIGITTYPSIAVFEAEAKRYGVSRRISGQALRRFQFGDRVFLFRKEENRARLFGRFDVEKVFAAYSDEAAAAIAAELGLRVGGAGPAEGGPGGEGAEPGGERIERECGFFDPGPDLPVKGSLPQLAGALIRHGATHLMIGGPFQRHEPVWAPIVFQRGFRTLDYEGLIRAEAEREPRRRLFGQFYPEPPEVPPAERPAPPGGRLVRLDLYVQRPSTRARRKVYDQLLRIPPAEAARAPAVPGVEALELREEVPYRVVPVFYATDRRDAGGDDPEGCFSGERGRDLVCGCCEVSIPDRHEPGQVERPAWFRLEFRESPEKHVAILRLERLPPDGFAARLAGAAARKPDQEALLFVHGYNVRFAEAVRRTAQLAFDLGGTLVPVCFSWPSAGALLRYAGDRENAEWAVPHLAQFLGEVVARGGARRIHLAAHSLGTLCLCRALVQYLDAGGATALFDNLILASPDIDRDIFLEQLAPRINDSKVGRRVTLYASSNDWALSLSEMLRGNNVPRAGTGGRSLVVAQDIDSVDASAVPCDLLGHSFVMEAARLLEDLAGLIVRRHPPDQRNLRRLLRGALPYWLIPAR